MLNGLNHPPYHAQKPTHPQLLKTIDDPAGDLQRVSGYVYEKVA